MLSINQLQKLDVFTHKNITQISPLNGGLSHRLYQVTYLDDYQNVDSRQGAKHAVKHCVLRYLNVSKHHSTLEYQIMMHVYALGLGPKPLALVDLTDAFGSLIVMEYARGEMASDCGFSDENVDQLATFLTTLHHADIRSLTPSTTPNSLALLDEYWLHCQFKTQVNKARFSAVQYALKGLIFNNTNLIHGDLNLSNILIDNDGMTWVDWEFSSLGDRYIDYAALCVESDQTIEKRLMSALEKASPLNTTIDTKRLALFKLYYATLCWLWIPPSIGQSLIGQQSRYEKRVDQLLTAIFDDDISSL